MPLPATMTHCIISGQNRVSGSTDNLHEGLIQLTLTGQTTIAGSRLPSTMTWAEIAGQNRTRFDLGQLPAGLYWFNIQGDNENEGSTNGLPAGLFHFTCLGRNRTTGTQLPPNLDFYNNTGFNTCAIACAALPRTLRVYGSYWVSGNPTAGLTGNLNDIPATLIYLNSIGGTLRVPSAPTLNAGLLRFAYTANLNTPLYSDEIDRILAAINALGTPDPEVDSPDVYLDQPSHHPSSAGDVSLAALIGRGWEVTVSNRPVGYAVPTVAGGTAAVLGANFAANEILFFSPSELPAGAATATYLAEWEFGQPSTFSNGDGSPSHGFWYPNATQPGHATYAFKRDTGNAVSGDCYIETQVTDGYSSQHAAQMWRNHDARPPAGSETGANLPADAYYSWWMRFPQVIQFDNVNNLGQFGFTNHVQWYSTTPANEHQVSLGAGRHSTNDDRFRWYVQGQGVASVDLPQLINPLLTIPTNQWIHVEVRYKRDPVNGRMEAWQDGVKFLDYTGPTCSSTAAGQHSVSWGNYGTAMIPANPIVQYDDCLISTKPVRPYLFP